MHDCDIHGIATFGLPDGNHFRDLPLSVQGLHPVY